MSFWSDLSPVVKGVIVVGGIGIVVALWVLLGLPPFGGEEQTQQRGLQTSSQ